MKKGYKSKTFNGYVIEATDKETGEKVYYASTDSFGHSLTLEVKNAAIFDRKKEAVEKQKELESVWRSTFYPYTYDVKKISIDMYYWLR